MNTAIMNSLDCMSEWARALGLNVNSNQNETALARLLYVFYTGGSDATTVSALNKLRCFRGIANTLVPQPNVAYQNELACLRQICNSMAAVPNLEDMSELDCLRAIADAPLDSAASSFFTRAGITNAGQKTAVNNLVLALKAAGVWTKLSALYPFVGGTAGTHAPNLISASYTITWSGTVTHDANGVTGNGSTGKGDTGLAGNALAANSLSFGFYSRTDSQEATRGIGVASNAGFYARYTDDFGYFDNADGASRLTVASPNSSGLITSSRTAAGANAAYRNGTSLGTNAIAQGTLSAANFFVCSDNSTFSVRNLALAFIGTGLTAGEVASFYTAVQAYQTSLNRQV